MKWVKSRKLKVLKDIEDGIFTESEAIQKYDLSLDELNEWRNAVKNHGEGALRVTRLNMYRRKY